MQRRIIALLASCAIGRATALVVGRSASSATEAVARTWMQRHPAPQGDELAELKTENPEAYAIVKALLTKRSLGLLDPKHPSASFAAPPPAAAEDEVPKGAAAFAKLAAPGELKSASVYPEAPPPAANHDWFSWKPASSAADDDAMVQNVLGAVAGLKGQQKPSKSLLSSEQESSRSTGTALDADAAALGVDAAASNPSPTQLAASGASQVEASALMGSATPVAPASPAAQSENSYLNGIDFGLKPATDVKRPVAVAQENSYLRGSGLESAASQQSHSDGPVPVSASQQSDSLASFSWDDNAGSKPVQATPAHEDSTPSVRLVQRQQQQQQQQKTSKQGAHSDALAAWLGGTKPTPAAPKASPPKPTPPAAPSNPYAIDLLG